MKNKVSIIVPVYNVDQYLDECVHSIFEQTYGNIEIILVDDGSTDDSGIKCDEFKEVDNRVQVIHQKNGGLPAARNAGLAVSSGEYIMFVDSDDLIDKRMVEILINRILSTNSDIAICNAQVFNREGYDKNGLQRYNDSVLNYTDENSFEFYYSALDACWNHMFKASLIKDNNIWFESKSIVAQEDFYFQVKVYSHANTIAYVNDRLYKYRERGSSISKRGQAKDFSRKCLLFTHYTREYIESNTERKCSCFYHYQFVNMLMTSINNVTENSLHSIIEVLKLFRNDTYYKESIRSNALWQLYPSNSRQHKYYRMLVRMIKAGITYLPASLEKARISRLRSVSRTDKYFD